MILSGTKPANIQVLPQCLTQLRHFQRITTHQYHTHLLNWRICCLVRHVETVVVAAVVVVAVVVVNER
jgi:hypothetical protein